MSDSHLEVIDSQYIAENVCFEDDFNTTFVLTDPLCIAKSYLAEEDNYKQPKKKRKLSTVSNNITLDSSLCINDTMLKSQQLDKNLKNWGLPDEITKKYEQNGIKEMFDWQTKCLSNAKVLLECKNLVYSAPTSAGKTLVAEILAMKTILERRKKVIIILPFVSIVREKTFYLQEILSSSGIRVEGFMGSQSPSGGLQAVHIAICTIEKANSLINKLIDEGNASMLGAVIVDELHLLGDPNRGYILELLLTKVKYVTSKFDDVNIQIVGMSATLPNLSVLASWLDAELYVTDYRPIPLEEFCLVEDQLYDNKCKLKTQMNHVGILTGESDLILTICLDTIKDGCSVLIFCMTKNRCESVAQTIASTFHKLGSSHGNEAGDMLRTQLNSEQISEVLHQIRSCPAGLDPIMVQTISFGVAYHHAGLSYEERDIIEGAFKSGALRVLVATSTLSSGVNLPARKVIIRSPVFQKMPISNMTYKQMVGRAGRMGKDSKGESILMCTANEKRFGFELMAASLDPVQSCLNKEDKYMRAVLEIIASEAACNLSELMLFTQCTLLSHQNDHYSTVDLTHVLDTLISFELIRVQTDEGNNLYVATSLGKACLCSSMGPTDALSLFSELEKARKCLVLDTDLHLVYLVTPFSVSSQWGDSVDWLHFLHRWESLSLSNKTVAQLVGVKEKFLITFVRGTSTNIKITDINIHKRFYTAMALQDLINEVPLPEVADKFRCSRGFLQSLQQGAATFAGMVTAFCHQLGWRNMELLISQFQDRLNFGIHSELIELMKLPSLNGARARCLFDNNFETVADIASADVNTLENVLHRSVPFHSEKNDDDENRKRTKKIWITGCRGMTVKELAEKLVLEARTYLEQELGIVDAKWVKTKSNEQLISSNCVDNKQKSEEEDRPKDQPFEISPASNGHSLLNDDDDISSPNHLVSKVIEIESNQNENADTSLLGQVSKHEVASSLQNIQPSDKDEILWDSIEFTDYAIQYVTEVSTTNNILSPNISFGEFDDNIISPRNVPEHVTESSKTTSFKDVSLFSSEGDNCSLFEESLPIDLIPSKLLDGKSESNETNSYKPSSDKTDDFTIDCNTLLKEFNSTEVQEYDDEEFELVYEDVLSENDELSFSESNENVIQTQTEEPLKEIEKTSANKPTTQLTCITKLEPVKRPLKKSKKNLKTTKKKHGNIFKKKVEKNVKNTTEKAPTKRTKDCTEESLTIANKVKKLSNRVLKPDLQQLYAETRPADELLQIKSKLHVFYPIPDNWPLTLPFDFDLNQNSPFFHFNIDTTTKLLVLILRGKDIEKNLNMLEKIKEVALFLETQHTEVVPKVEKIIGAEILVNVLGGKIETICELVKGVSIYFGSKVCIYMDLHSIKTDFVEVRAKLSKWFMSILKWRMLSLKTDYLCLKKCLGVNISAVCEDVFFTEWLINKEDMFPNIHSLIQKYCWEGMIGNDLSNKDISGCQKTLSNMGSIESAVFKSWCIWVVIERQKQTTNYKIMQNIIEIEHQIAKILTDCEYYGVAMDKNFASEFLVCVKSIISKLEQKCYETLGRRLNFNSSADVAKALGLMKSYSSRNKVKTNKAVLSAHKNTLASVVIYWRKLNAILTNILYPLIEKIVIRSHDDENENGNVKRIRPRYTMYTSTGRISMEQPNLQCVPRPFSIPSLLLPENNKGQEESGTLDINCRRIFVAPRGHKLVSADYCQLEMRILTHCCADEKLTQVMTSGADVFTSIAMQWCDSQEVDDDLRQRAKQLCYGVIYGMGSKTLAQHLDVVESDAVELMASFHNTYPNIGAFTSEVVRKCKELGYVETLMKRRRYLPDITSQVPARRSAAERKAVNTTIQGSAADIAKAAMCAVAGDAEAAGVTALLVLQLHDELIYEVPEQDHMQFAGILKGAMEKTVKLDVPLPVKVKVGDTWGTLQEVDVT